ncbi:MAG: ROK family protein [Elusimicrobiota bacterium]|jgi:glucokinase|nr:ROK family protein [Elusimicrobiota bacterium]
MAEKLYLGVDMGGTHIKIAAVLDNGNIVEEIAIDTDTAADPKAVVKEVIQAAKKFKTFSEIENIGVGIAGDIEYKTGFVRFSPNLPKWKNVQLKKLFEQLTHKKTLIDNDANTAAIGAFWLDDKGKSESLICVTLGTGVGGGIIINKKLYHGASGAAGEIGHITIDLDGQKCNCSNRGCIETFVGAKYLVNSVKAELKKSKSVTIDKLTNKNHLLITPEILFNAANLGDKISKDAWKKAGIKLGAFLSIILNFFNPETIIFCGGISCAHKFFLKIAVKEAQKRAFQSALKACEIKVSKYGNKLGVVGAAMLSKQ